MTPWPILRRELKAAALRRDAYTLRVVMATVLGVVVAVAGGVVLRGDFLERSTFPAEGLKQFGAGAIVGVSALQVFVLAFLVPSLVGGAIAEERERDTLPYLLLTRLTPLEIVLAKLVGRLAPAVSLAIVGAPFVAFSAYLAGLFPEVAALTFVAVLGTTVTMGAISLRSSARFARAGNARATAMVTVWGWLILPPVLAFLPNPPYVLGAVLVWPVRQFGRWVGPSSPLSLGLNWWWLATPGYSGLAEAVGQMAATQAVVCVIAVALAAVGVRRHDPRRMAVLEAQDRPPCGDDPIFWREFTLPNRNGFMPRPLALVRQALTLVRLIGSLLLQLLVVLLTMAVPIGLLGATLTLGAPAFQEAWLGGKGVRGRADLHWVIVIMSAAVSLGGLMGATAMAAARVVVEREKSTWLALLATPLEGREILGGKLRATAMGHARVAAAALGALWLAGAICGAIHPLGMALAAADLAAATWLSLSLGTWLGLRPTAPSTANSLASFAALALTAVHVPYILLALFPPYKAPWDWGLSPGRLAGMAALSVGVPLATAGLAFWCSGRAFGRFDQYVGRPIRSANGR